MRPRLVLAIFLCVLPALPARGQANGDVVEVLRVSGPLDDRLMRFVMDSIEEAAAGGVEAVVLQVDSPGVIGTRATFERLLSTVENPALPVAVWVGPEPAVAFGGVLQLVAAAPFSGAAPGSRLGFGVPTVSGRPDPADPLVDVPTSLRTGVVEMAADRLPEGVVDVVQPSLRQFVILDLDGRTFQVGGRDVEVSTVVPVAGSEDEVTNAITVIRDPSLWDRFLRLASRPEAAFFFLVTGLTVAAFEFYAIGPGLAAAVAAVSLGLAGYGVAVLPVRAWALAVTVLAILVLAASYQMGGVATISGLGIVALSIGGFAFTDAAPQIVPGAAGVLLTVAAAAFFFLLAMPTVARSRFSTPTIGRGGLVGRTGAATTRLDPDGEVEVDGARWRATSHRESGIGPGDGVVVTGVDGWFLEVEPELANGRGREKR